MSLAAEMAHTRADREKSMKLDWYPREGPIEFEPLEFFSVFKALASSGLESYSLTVRPWFSIMTLCMTWMVVLNLWIDETMPWLLEDIIQEGLAFAGILGAAISFLLAFRLARAAQRFFEARLAAGLMILNCRLAASNVMMFLEHDTETRDEFLRWLSAAPVAVKNNVRSLKGIKGKIGDLTGLLSIEQAEAMLAAGHQPLYCVHLLRAIAWRALSKTKLEPIIASTVYQDIASAINAICAAAGTMERINNTPIPFAYTAHVRLFLIIYLAWLAIVFCCKYGWMAIPSVAVVSLLLLGTDTAAAESERPFHCRSNHLPLERYCLAIADNIIQILNMPPPSLSKRDRPVTPASNAAASPAAVGETAATAAAAAARTVAGCAAQIAAATTVAEQVTPPPRGVAGAASHAQPGAGAAPAGADAGGAAVGGRSGTATLLDIL